jgi:hypothetical protein
MNPQHLATILAALRNWQISLEGGILQHSDRFADHFTDHEPLTTEEIDALCESLNCGDSPACNAPTGESESPLLPDAFPLRLDTSTTLGDGDVAAPAELRHFARACFGMPSSIVIAQLYEDEAILYIEEQLPDERDALIEDGWPARFIDFLIRCQAEYGVNYVRLV